MPKTRKRLILLPRAYPADWAGKIPGLLKYEKAIWSRFLSQEKSRIKRIYYNVRIGLESDIDKHYSPRIAYSWYMTASLRVDAIIERPNEVEIIEIRPHAGRAALGAALTYYELWRKEQPIKKRAFPVVVTDHLPEIFQHIYHALGVRWYVV
jgi:hypothetical protein